MSPRKSTIQDGARPRGATIALAGALLITAASATACQQKPWERDVTFTEGRTFAGDVEVDAATLNDGRDAYMHYCYACHGMNGDGHGPSSYGLRPPPRDFTAGVFKFARLRASDEMPNDEDLERIVLGGLHGTPMLPWDIPRSELHNIIQYIKTLGPLNEEGKQEHKGSKWERVNKKGAHLKVVPSWEPEADPWAGKEQEAVLRGKELYHLRAECVNCHPGYDTKEELYKMSVEANKRAPDSFSVLKGFRDDLYHSQLKKSDEYHVQIMPPDFTMDQVRSAHGLDDQGRPYTETRIRDIYRILSFGVYPVMPAWKDAGLTPSDIYALSYYVKSLIDMRGKPEAIALQQRVLDQKAFEIPKPPEEAKPADQAGDKKEGDQTGDKKEGDQATDKKDEKAGDAKDAKKDEKAGDAKDAKKDEKKPEDAKKDSGKKPEEVKAPTPKQ